MADDHRDPEGTREEDERERGRRATSPREIPRAGWRDVLLRVKRSLGQDNVGIVAAGVAFYALLAIVPALAALVSIYGLVSNPADAERLVSTLEGAIPAEAQQVLGDQLHALVTRSGAVLGISAIGSILLAIWSSTKGTRAIMVALTIVYGEHETRGFLRKNVTALLLTLAMVVGALLALAGVVIAPAALQWIGLGGQAETLISLARWPVLAAALMVGLAVFYRFGPSRADARWRWVSWGAAVSVVLWLGASALFSLYVSNFGSYDETYGSLGAVVVLLLWFYISAYIILLGAELNSELEHQTLEDSTTGAPRPMGERGAHVADTVGEVP